MHRFLAGSNSDKYVMVRETVLLQDFSIWKKNKCRQFWKHKLINEKIYFEQTKNFHKVFRFLFVVLPCDTVDCTG